MKSRRRANFSAQDRNVNVASKRKDDENERGEMGEKVVVCDFVLDFFL